MTFDWRNPERVAPWKPKQRFLVTEPGRAAAETYRAAVRRAQGAQDPRLELERAKGAWATSLGLKPVDGILLEDLAAGRTCLAELRQTIEACDLSLREARAILDRLVAARLIEPLERAPAV
ncbi:MAG: hypothetical protein E6K78_09500 [Candidatus Eisenbacteria bacterium]|uniref:PqqD family protein n=1 Tax=Eiseniibacteriota bacterium TaxID=2212470 RepID=A0A538TL17_UNCEI|nr:MAG: hypothetical protein E6K78_09500 [Candidatus Eisenbacteria bacterium]